jgi:hypothetical protein
LEGQALVITTTAGIKTLDGIKTGVIRMEIPLVGKMGTASYFDGSYLSLSSPTPAIKMALQYDSSGYAIILLFAAIHGSSGHLCIDSNGQTLAD